MFGEDGLAMVRYVGPYTGSIKGPCTGHLYGVKGHVAMMFFADARDAEGLLKMQSSEGGSLFEE